MEEHPTPLLVISGFLGCGKTTLVNHLLRTELAGRPVAVVVNDFGSLAVDAALIEHAEENMLTLRSGCVCCSLAGDLLAGLDRLLRGGPYERIVLETSGIARLGGLLTVLGVPELRGRLALERVVVVANATRHGELSKMLPILNEQVSHGDVIVLNRCDEATADQVAAAREGFRAVNPDAEVLESVQSRLRLSQLLSGAEGKAAAEVGADRAADTAAGSSAATGEEWTTCRITFAAPVDRGALERALARLPESVHRVKGFVEQEGGGVLQVNKVGATVSLEPFDREPRGASSRCLVAVAAGPVEQRLKGVFESIAGAAVTPDSARHEHG